jgi:G3E family GTPase
MNLGINNIGKAAYIFERDLQANSYVLKDAVIVNEIGNVAINTNQITDVMVLVAE